MSSRQKVGFMQMVRPSSYLSVTSFMTDYPNAIGLPNAMRWSKNILISVIKAAGEYNVRPQYEKLEIAATLNWDAAHEAASWGFGQVMAFLLEKAGL